MIVVLFFLIKVTYTTLKNITNDGNFFKLCLKFIISESPNKSKITIQ